MSKSQQGESSSADYQSSSLLHEYRAEASASDGGGHHVRVMSGESRQERVQNEPVASGSDGGGHHVRVMSGESRRERVQNEPVASGSDGGRPPVTKAVQSESGQERVQDRRLEEHGWQILKELNETYARIGEHNVESGQLYGKLANWWPNLTCSWICSIHPSKKMKCRR
jgi:hypothetical protein